MLLLSRQQPRRCLVADLCFLVGTGIALAVALPFGARAYLIGSSCVQFAVLALVLHWLSQIGVIQRKDLFRSLIPAVASSAIAAGLAFALVGLLRRDPDTLGTAVIWSATFGLSYVIVLRLLFRRPLQELVGYFPGRAFIARALLLDAP
jgi:hypothetical protein